MLKSWMKPFVLIGLLGIILYSGSALNVFNDGHTHSHTHSHSDGENADHHHNDKKNENTLEDIDKSNVVEIANVKKAVEEETKVEKNAGTQTETTQTQDLHDQNKSEHHHDGHDHKH